MKLLKTSLFAVLLMPLMASAIEIECSIVAHQMGDWSTSLVNKEVELHLDQVTTEKKDNAFQPYPVYLKVNGGQATALGRTDRKAGSIKWLKLTKTASADNIYMGLESNGNLINVGFNESSKRLIIGSIYSPSGKKLTGIMSEFGKCGD